jgi:putative Ca2+/H+ antiporter (TMEM165/GDT1 family)
VPSSPRPDSRSTTTAQSIIALPPPPHTQPHQIFLNAFSLTFLAEWGDRSQIATIGLAASQDVIGVTVGSILGHAACTAAAVLGGRHLATHIDERTVGVGGWLGWLSWSVGLPSRVPLV